MRRRRPWLIAFFVLVALGIVGGIFATNGGKAVRVKAARLEKGRVEEIVTANSVGTVEPVQTAIIASEIVGRIRRIHVRQGPVRAGQAVFELDARDLRAEREVTIREIETARARVSQAELRKKKVWDEFERFKRVDVPKGDVERLERDLEIAKQDEEIARLSIRTLEAQLQVIDLRLSKTTVAAPFAGTVVTLHSEEGESVTPGRSLFTLHSAGELLVRAPLDEVDMGRVAIDLPVRVTFDAYRPRKFEGVVHEIMPSASTDKKNNRTVDIKVRIPGMPENIKAGMSANVEVVIRGRDDVFYLPTHLVHDDREGRGQFVYVAEGGRAVRRYVKTGFANWETIEILEGVRADDPVIVPLPTEDEQSLKDGLKVVVVEHGR
jgi:RND family efflux transporter MFP subunit